jgi:phosphopantothenate synthetase
VTIAVGHARIVTFIYMTTERTEGTDTGADRAAQRDALLVEHRAARARREQAALGSDEFRAAAEEIARIEVEINRLEEPN